MPKDRNCGGNTPYPVYPMYGYGNMPGPLPINGINMPMPLPFPEPTVSNNSGGSSEVSALSNKVNNLEQRVSNLENLVNKSYSGGYNTSNYQIM